MKFMSSYPQIAINAKDIMTASNVVTMTLPTKSLAPAVSTLDPEIAWKRLVARDRNARFVYGVTTTGVFCRPGCASRRPLRENVRFFETVAEARAAGFRACKRCRPTAIADRAGRSFG